MSVAYPSHIVITTPHEHPSSEYNWDWLQAEKSVLNTDSAAKAIEEVLINMHIDLNEELPKHIRVYTALDIDFDINKIFNSVKNRKELLDLRKKEKTLENELIAIRAKITGLDKQ